MKHPLGAARSAEGAESERQTSGKMTHGGFFGAPTRGCWRFGGRRLGLWLQAARGLAVGWAAGAGGARAGGGGWDAKA